jgi:hypothetical protein
MPEFRRREFLDRLDRRLPPDQAMALAATFRTLTPEPAPDATPQPAGTDLRAAIAIADSLTIAFESEERPEEVELVNAIALRRSIPAGPERRALDLALARALVSSGNVADALEIVRDAELDADALLAIALDRLPKGQAAEAAIRFLPEIEPGGPIARRAAMLFDEVGLSETVRLFAVRDAPSLSTVPSADMPAESWVRRDLVEFLAETDEDGEEAPRRALARLVLDRNGAVAEDDFDRARETLDRARSTRDAIAALLQSADGP